MEGRGILNVCKAHGWRFGFQPNIVRGVGETFEKLGLVLGHEVIGDLC